MGCCGASNSTFHYHALKNKSPPIVRHLIDCLPSKWRKGVICKNYGVAMEEMFPLIQARYITSMNHALKTPQRRAE